MGTFVVLGKAHGVAGYHSQDGRGLGKGLRVAAYSADSINTYHAVLHVILEAAVEAKKIPANPARRKRNRGRRVGRKSRRAPKKVITDTRGALLIAERMALLSERDDEFVAMILKYFTGIRLGELIGLETKSVTRYRAIADVLNAEQLPTPTGRSPWRHSHVYRLLGTQAAREFRAHPETDRSSADRI